MHPPCVDEVTILLEKVDGPIIPNLVREPRPHLGPPVPDEIWQAWRDDEYRIVTLQLRAHLRARNLREKRERALYHEREELRLQREAAREKRARKRAQKERADEVRRLERERIATRYGTIYKAPEFEDRVMWESRMPSEQQDSVSFMHRSFTNQMRMIDWNYHLQLSD